MSPLRFLTSIRNEVCTPLQFSCPYGLAVHAGCLFIADAETNRVTAFTLCGRFLHSFGVYYSPAFIAVRPDGKLLVGRLTGHRVELRTQFGSLLQVRLPHVYAAHMLRTGHLTRFRLLKLSRTKHITRVAPQVITSSGNNKRHLLCTSGGIYT